MNNRPITDRLAAGGQYAMNTPPDFAPPDDVDVIRAQLVWEATDEYVEAVRDWMVEDDGCVGWACEEFTRTAAYDRAFGVWLDRQIP